MATDTRLVPAPRVAALSLVLAGLGTRCHKQVVKVGRARAGATLSNIRSCREVRAASRSGILHRHVAECREPSQWSRMPGRGLVQAA